jgi:N-acetylglucosaminyldiphosphoundecaprenol N-acetyl-beta-D-mannosaminyltransferase
LRTLTDDFDRDVYCLLGLPFDAVSLAQAVQRLRNAAEWREPCFLSTPNLNFLIGCQTDAAFRDSVINSDLSVADGMPLVWMARLLGIPIRERVAGSGLFEVLRRGGSENGKPIAVYFFGGPEGVAEVACQALNRDPDGLVCAGFESPGFGSVEDMSSEGTINRINASGADFLVVSLGAKKGQAWIERNRARITVPVISHLGAVVNFAAGTVSRAPGWMQRAGLEWLWRIKEEPALWKRYGNDGIALLYLLFTRLLPYALWLRLAGPGRASGGDARMDMRDGRQRVLLTGTIADPVSQAVRRVLREAVDVQGELVVDCSGAVCFGPGLFGLLQMLDKRRRACAEPLRFAGLNPRMRRLFRWNGVAYLLDRT